MFEIIKSISCDTRHWMIRKAVLAGLWPKVPLHFTNPLTGSTQYRFRVFGKLLLLSCWFPIDYTYTMLCRLSGDERVIENAAEKRVRLSNDKWNGRSVHEVARCTWVHVRYILKYPKNSDITAFNTSYNWTKLNPILHNTFPRNFRH
jgi:hypothetical protein